MLLLLTIGISFSFSITFVKIINFISMYMITNKIPKFRKNKQLSALGISPSQKTNLHHRFASLLTSYLILFHLRTLSYAFFFFRHK